ncbi:ATP-binding cassette, variant 2 [Blastomyces dermatitidis ER-3]|uniref:ABC multidrug transporter MDR2 n=2 Tax=Blastomyces TaxID=229219 RepID=A0A179U8S0_BLAGS|nr:ATP-binding cassette [Blastomyces gilchristii SLH14081]XP_031576148.1 ATP-binding cassette, variant 1 [Blastomyces gilchristii SLH14081]XP_031576149.1 ATP-binding cassette, variant 2 [Blastomyces gilchristii SLH14081]XP_045280695.1 ATP-binding cassette [Blastomyces dermatitidis ER-3]XP_045280696.1 ATP-binding cassette, variant 1 [Blastomyces dermatitidis ER-3]XP_045280697.1 ATP-binding cassette, variant 2 [Blastomyces dermatitidis ER-3]EQL30000.1 hypothetical protein BDFG_07481 [Blastomyce
MCSLSGGELQRVAIAGVILKNSKIVLLDKATSSLDSEIEASPIYCHGCGSDSCSEGWEDFGEGNTF